MKRKQRLAIITNWYPSVKYPYYGIFVKNQALLLSQGYDVHIVLLSNSLFTREMDYEDDGLSIHHRYSFYLPKRNVYTYKQWAKKYATYIQKLDKELGFDIIHAHDYQPAIAAYNFKKITGKKYFTTIHNTDFLTHSIAQYKDPIIAEALKQSEKVISVGSILKSELVKKYHLENVIVIPNHVDTSKFNIKPNKIKDTVNFLLVGYLNKVKGTKKVIEAFLQADIEHSQLHLVGENNLENGYLERIISRNPQIIYHGSIEHSEMPKIYQQCDCLISYSEVETFGITAIEAMACGLPVIYRASGGPEDLVPEYAGIPVSYHTEELAQKLHEFVNLKDHFDSQKIRQNTINKYSSKVVINELKKVYQNINK